MLNITHCVIHLFPMVNKVDTVLLGIFSISYIFVLQRDLIVVSTMLFFFNHGNKKKELCIFIPIFFINISLKILIFNKS